LAEGAPPGRDAPKPGRKGGAEQLHEKAASPLRNEGLEVRHTWETDVLVVGGGIAAVLAACKVREQGADVLLVDQGHVGRSGCTAVASGVIELFLPGDDVDVWARGEKSPLANHVLYKESLPQLTEIYRFLEREGVRFVKDGEELVRLPSGRLEVPSQLMFAEGGPQLGIALRAAALRHGARILNRVVIRGLLTSDNRLPTQGRVVGAVGFGTRSADTHVFRTKCVVMCTGPFSIPFGRSTRNWATRYMPIAASGDGHHAMWEAGAVMSKMEMGYQAPRGTGFMTAPALEMLAGLGGHTVYVNRSGARFLSPEFRRREWGRSAVFTAIMREVAQGRGPVSVDVTHFTPEQRRLLKQVVPIVIGNFESAGYDLAKEVVPYAASPPIGVGSAGGGAKINTRGETSVPGLYAAGNCSNGAYVLLGQSLKIAGLTGSWAGENSGRAANSTKRMPSIHPEQVAEHEQRYFSCQQVEGGLPWQAIRDKLTDIRLSLVPTMNASNLRSAVEEVHRIGEEDLPRMSADDARELVKVNALKSSVPIMGLVLQIMEHRTESRGNLIRDDYPFTDNENWLVHTLAQAVSPGESKIWDVPIPRDWWITKPEPGKEVHNYFATGMVSS
jgi:succinate dehydrogenase/fumarate reductase flavoprotein subunit